MSTFPLNDEQQDAVAFEALRRLILSHAPSAMREWGDGVISWGLLITGPPESLDLWYLDVGGEPFGQRGQTVRLRLWGRKDHPTSPIVRAVAVARKHDVTLQLLCVHEPIEESAETHDLGGGASVTVRDCRETYPVLHLGSHGLRWGPTPRG